jgi:hypothetical protein
MDRRSFLIATAASLVAPPAMAAVPRLSDYTVFLGNGNGSVEDVTSGIRFRGGEIDDFGSGVRLFRNVKVKRSGSVRYQLTREIVPGKTTSNGVWFNIGLVWNHNPASLDEKIPNGDEAIAPLFKGFRITHANENTVLMNASNKIRLRTYPKREDIRPREAQVTDVFAKDVAHNMELVWKNGLVTLYDRTMGLKVLKQSFKRNNILNPPVGGAWLMWYASSGSGYLLENVTVS